MYIRLHVLAVRLLNTQAGIFFSALSQLFIFPLPACLFSATLGALAVCLIRTAIFSQGALLVLLMV